MTEIEENAEQSVSENGDSGSEEAEEMDLADLDLDSDEELQEAFAAGLLKPGLNNVRVVKKKEPVNNIAGLKQKLSEFRLDLPWIERLDMVNRPAPLAPELAYKEDQHAKEREKTLKANKNLGVPSVSEDPVHNDFVREMMFYRQAQAAVLEAIPRLKAMGVPTRRPEDYFAQMAKSDQHMQKIREKLVSKQVTEERLEKIRKLRDLRKFGKKVQVEVQQKRQKEKRDMLEQVKKFRKGQTTSIDFLEDEITSVGGGDKQNKNGKKAGERNKKAALAKRKQKDQKFGFGGKKKGSKMNSKSSVNDTTSYKVQRAKGGKPNMAQKLKNKRLGKGRRQNAKNKKK